MSNTIKYSESTEQRALNKGNWWIGTGDSNKGPSDVTGYYAGVTPPSSGYTIYTKREDNLPSIFVAQNDQELIFLTNQISESNFTTTQECLNYFQGQDDKLCVNREYENIVTDGLILNLDASYVSSYPESGNIWYDLSGGGHNGTLINGVSFTGSGASKALSFDGTDDYVNIGTDPEYNNLSVISINIWLYEYSPRRSGLTGGNTMILSNSRDCCGTYYGFDLKSNLGRTYWVLWNGTQTDVRYNTVVGTDMWYNISLTYDGSVAKIYYNGQLVTTKNATNAMAGPATTTLRVGAMGLYPNYEYFGKMGCVQLYNRAITSTEVLQNYNAQKHRFGL